jgi:hypothetical protein
MASKEFLCFAGCLQFAVKETSGLEIDQAIVANQLGVVIPTDFDSSELLAIGIQTIRHDLDPRLWGIEPVVAEINKILEEAHTALECRFEDISKFQDWEFEDLLISLTATGLSPIVGFDYKSLFGGPGLQNLGHCAVVRRVQKINGKTIAEIHDPGPNLTGLRTVDVYSLYRACRKRHGGVWIVAPQSRAEPVI